MTKRTFGLAIAAALLSGLAFSATAQAAPVLVTMEADWALLAKPGQGNVSASDMDIQLTNLPTPQHVWDFQLTSTTIVAQLSITTTRPGRWRSISRPRQAPRSVARSTLPSWPVPPPATTSRLVPSP